MSIFSILWIMLAAASGGLEAFTLVKNRKGTLSQTLRRNIKPVRIASAVGWLGFAGWFFYHIWFAAPSGTQPLFSAHRPPVTRPAATCMARAGGVLPDPTCQPGATNPLVTQATIHQTICVSGWTTTVRPPASYTTALKIKQMKAYGLSGSTTQYEEDHLIPLEVGGDPRSPLNLWPEPRAGAQGAGVKDLEENRLKHEVCAGTLTLAAAQQAISADWRSAP